MHQRINKHISSFDFGTDSRECTFTQFKLKNSKEKLGFKFLPSMYLIILTYF